MHSFNPLFAAVRLTPKKMELPRLEQGLKTMRNSVRTDQQEGLCDPLCDITECLIAALVGFKWHNWKS